MKRGAEKWKAYSIILFFLFILLIGCQKNDKESEGITYSPVDPHTELQFHLVERVVDGDTAIIGGERVRFLLIDTPETVHPDKPVQPFGPEASAFTKEMIEGKTVGLELDVGERDQYGRVLAYIWVETEPNHYQMLNASLVQEGLAQVVVYQPNVRHVDILRELQKEAQEEHRGIWGQDE
jgi:micrococcal nuclease